MVPFFAYISEAQATAALEEQSLTHVQSLIWNQCGNTEPPAVEYGFELGIWLLRNNFPIEDEDIDDAGELLAEILSFQAVGQIRDREAVERWLGFCDGANEVCRPLDNVDAMENQRCVPISVTLASGSQTEAYTSMKDGEVHMEMAGGEWIVGVGRLAAAGFTFVWDVQGPSLTGPSHERLKVQLRNGLPYMPWEAFKKIRSRLSTCHRKAPHLQQARPWGASIQEESPSILNPGERMALEKQTVDIK